MAVKYIDVTAIVQMIGVIYTNPKVLDAEDKYKFTKEDFPDEFHQIIFGSLYNLYQLGAKEFTLHAIEDYLKQRPKKFAIYEANKGAEYILKCAEIAKPAAFDYYYNRLKKMSLLRAYNTIAGMDLNWLYDPDNIFDVKKKQEQEDKLDNSSLEEIANLIDDKMLNIRSTYVDGTDSSVSSMGDGAFELLEELKESPEIGYPLFGTYMNTVTRGARLSKFYLRSAATGVGKSRAMIADACYIGCSQMYDLTANRWISTGQSQPTLYIATEQDLKEVQTMAMAFLSGVDEDHILNGEYFEGEWERVLKAAQLLKTGKVFFISMPDFSLLDIENAIKRNIRENNVTYIFLDYIHTSMKILEEITKRSGGVKLREDNILFMISIRLKDIANQYKVFIMSSTQLNSDYREAKEYDQNLLRGAKSIADKIDWGAIMLEVTGEDLESIQPILTKGGFERPQIKISIYKNRRGRWKNILLWCKANRAICRIEPMFVTHWDHSLVEDIKNLKINIPDETAF